MQCLGTPYPKRGAWTWVLAGQYSGGNVLREQVGQSECNHLGRPSKIFQEELLVGAMAVRLQQGMGPRSVEHRRNPCAAVKARVGVDGDSIYRNLFGHDGLGVVPNCIHELFLARNRRQGPGKKYASRRYADTRNALTDLVYMLNKIRLDGVGRLFRNYSPINPHRGDVGHNIGIDSPVDQSAHQRRM